MPEKYRQALPWIGVAAVIVIVAVWLAIWYSNRSAAPQGAAANPAPVYAQKGQVIAGFPQELILGSTARVTNSYSISYASLGQYGYTAQWNSSSSITTLYNAYKDYFTKNGWTIENQTTAHPTLQGLYATDGTHDANVVITAQGTGSQVIIGYSTR